MSIVQHIKVLDSQLANIKIVAGSTIYTRDTGKHFIDISDTERVQISDVVYIDTDKERIALLAPLPDKLYITRDTNKVWIYSVKTDKWVCLNTDTTYTAGTGININGTTINNSGVRAVTAGASANQISVNTNGTSKTITINNVANATSASKATNDSAGQQINTTYIKGLSVSGKVITYTKGDGTTGTITTQDSNTWRGIQNVLTSDSTTESLSAAQGKVLKGLVDGKADKATTLDGYGITDAKIADGVITLGANTITPLTSHQSLSAYAKTADMNTALAKKADKTTTLAGYGITDAKISGGVITLGSNTITPLTSHQSLSNYYTKSKVDELITNLKAGLVNVVESLPTTGEKGILYLVKTGSESENVYTEYIYVNDAWEKLGTQKLDLSGYLTKTDAANTYLGKTAAAASANKLNTNAGSATQPVYFSNGVPVATTYTLGKSVPSNAVFTDTNNKVTQFAVTDADYTNYSPLVWGASNSSTKDFTPSTVTDGVFTSKGLYVQPSSGLIHATTFEGNLTGTASNAAKVNNLTVLTAVPANAKFTDTVYTHPSTHPASMITGLATVATSGSYNDLTNKPTIPAAYSLPDATTSAKGGVKVGSNLTISSGTLSLTKANVTAALGYTPPTTDTNTHYTTGLIVGKAATDIANAAATNGNVFLNLKDDSTIRNSHKIIGSGATTVTSDDSGNITISSTNTVYSHPSSGVTAGTYRSVTVNAQGHVTSGSNPTTLAGYGITDAKISNGTITLGSASITPLTSHQSLSAYVTKATADSTYLGKTATAAAASKLTLDQGTADKARPVIFQDSGLSTSALTACYNNNLTYNPVSNNLVVGKINGFTIGASVPAGAKFTDTVYTHPSSHPASMITGLAKVATSGSYNDLTNKPTSLPANGGNASTATKASQDGNGNNIVSTYRTKSDSYSLADTRRLFECMVPYGTNIPEKANLNTATYLKIGNYYYCNLSATAASMTNCPTNEAFMMRVYSPLSTTIDNESSSAWVYRLREIITLSGTTYRQYVFSKSTAGSFSYNSWKQVAFTSDIPTKLPANGGDAATVNGHTVNVDVPANAKFTDTVYSLPDATTSVKGGVKVGSNISISSGTISLTKANVVAALGYTPPTTDTNTDTKVTNTLATTTKAYVTGTTGATTNTGTQVFDTGVYLDTTAGTLVAKTFKTSTGIEIY